MTLDLHLDGLLQALHFHVGPALLRSVPPEKFFPASPLAGLFLCGSPSAKSGECGARSELLSAENYSL